MASASVDMTNANAVGRLHNQSESRLTNAKSTRHVSVADYRKNLEMRTLDDYSVEQDEHYQEMLRDLEKHTELVGAQPADDKSKWEVVFYTSLRTMLRECLFTKDVGLRKAHLERVYSWYIEKKKQREQRLLESKKKQQKAKVESEKAPVKGERSSLGRSQALRGTPDAQALLQGSSLLADNEAAAEALHEILEQASVQRLRQTGAPTKADTEPAVSKPRDMDVWKPGKETGDKTTKIVAPAQRVGVQTPAEQAAQEQVDAVAMERDQASGSQQLYVAEQMKQYKRRNLFASAGKPRPLTDDIIVMQGLGPDGKPKQKPVLQSSFHHYDKKDEREEQMEAIWLKMREDEVNEEREQKEVDQAIENWAVQRSRMEEEIIRRQEALRYASQTSNRYNAGTPADLSNTLTPDMSGMVSDVEEEPEEAEDAPPQDNVLSDMQMPVIVRKKQKPKDAIWLSPYDNLDMTKRGPSPMFQKDSQAPKGFKSPHINARRSVTPCHQPPLPSDVKPKKAQHIIMDPRARQMAPPVAPSQRRIQQLEECEKIKQAFAKYGISCPASVLEKALVVPEDKSYQACLMNLPGPIGSLHGIPDPMKKKDKKKGKKGKKGKGKKGGKKKK